MNAEPPLETLILFRIVLTDPPTIDDMRSHLALGIPIRRNDLESRRLAGGISLFDSLQRARKQARRKPWLGNAFIAEMAIPTDRLRIEKTAGPGHYTAWGDPGVCQARGARDVNLRRCAPWFMRFGIPEQRTSSPPTTMSTTPWRWY